MALTWKEQLKNKLQSFGSKKANALIGKYSHSFPLSYAEAYAAETAIDDIHYMEKLSPEKPLELYFYYSKSKEGQVLHLRLFQWEKAISLSIILPILENLDLKTESEQPHKITLNDKEIVWISDFIVVYKNGFFDIDKIKNLFQDAFINIYFGLAENDGLNNLLLSASLSWHEISILRAYTKYLHQIRFRFSQKYIETTLGKNSAIAKNLVEFFKVLHDPSQQSTVKKQSSQIEKTILENLEAVSSLDEDRIIRRIFDLIKATLRTNYFQTLADNKKSYLSFKLKSNAIPELPLPAPLYEIFVYSPRFEAIHLRNTKVARGGIRWSDRREDFRTEILGLMKAQKVKNAVIVPSGAKGGFVLKKPMETASRQDLQAEVIDCYKLFIMSLLELTDNIVEKNIVSAKGLVCYDDADPYLVVAADKGTATFSDIANGISKEFNFWLGDAFASGGETGYDHKKMGITARGAWESVKRHFRELEIDTAQTAVTVIGIGDMSGDVFGNGMIYSKQIKLVGAFDHRDIFIDPDPDLEISFYERTRLFNLPASSWKDYNAKLISKGGGVFSRNLKSIPLTTQMKEVLAIEVESLTPTELIRAMLAAPVDLLFNGGIGTYVKASNESHADVGDRTNDYCRINGNELRCKVVGEGGNLGFTQLGRIEYALTGGLINTDFIDNSAGVDCSDHEVNLKILLNPEVKKGNLTEKKRNQLLASLTQEVAELVLHDNYSQALVMSFSSFHSKKNMGLHAEYIKEMEVLGIIDRQIEFLPDDKKLLERKTAGEGLTRPELAVLLAYSKIHIKHEILKSHLPEDSYLIENILETSFPPTIRKKYKKIMNQHPLHRDIVATQLSNQIVNEMGITFVYRLQIETGATAQEVVRAYIIASHVFASAKVNHIIESLGFKISLSSQYEMLYHIRNLINLSTRWFLRRNYLDNNLADTIEHFSKYVRLLETAIPNLMSGFTKQYLHSLTEEFLKLGVSKEIAQHIATYRAIYTLLNIIDITTKYQSDLMKTAKIYFKAGETINLVWFRDQIAHDAREGHWNVLARLTLRDELDASQRALTIAIMQIDAKETDPERLLAKWVEKNKRGLERWETLLNMLHASTNIEYSMFFIALRELMGLVLDKNVIF